MIQPFGLDSEENLLRRLGPWTRWREPRGVAAYTLGRGRVRQIFSGTQSAGRHAQFWDGRDDRGNLAIRGMYLLRVEVDSDKVPFARMQPVGVTY